jgi:hypothetical protein
MMNYYYVITGNYESKKGKQRRWHDREVHIDKLSERELKNRLKSNYYGKVRWLTINGTMTMIHRLLEDRILEETDEYRKTGFIIYGEEVRPTPIEVVTEYNLENAWLLSDEDFDFKGRTDTFCKEHADEPSPEAEEIGE